jgi:Protein of unknown function (DUF3995)
MLQIAHTFNTIIFLAISGLHFYWAYCSLFKIKAWGFEASIPEKNGIPLFNPSTFSALIIAAILLLFAKISSYSSVQNNGNEQFEAIAHYGNLVIVVIFFVRAIGEFKYVGFFKKVKGSKFAEFDTKYYTPLCLLISVLAVIVFLN